MKAVDKLLERCGTDKVLHFAVGAAVSANVAIAVGGAMGCTVGTGVTLCLSYVKEVVADDSADWRDFAYGVAGAALPWLSLLCAMVVR